MRVTIAGASGFVGRNFINHYKNDLKIRALSRSEREDEGELEWRSADLFSYQSVSPVLEGTDVAIYLVHSMLPNSRLFQGDFQDTDLFLADNFARACKRHGVKQIIYLGGLDPEKSSSQHLESRKEVEEVFRATGIATTVLRAGMVVGKGGSSFEILKNLVLNLPMMILPQWTKSNTQAIYIEDLIRVLKYCIGNEKAYNKTINVVNGESITYKELIEVASERFKGPKLLIPVPINYTSFSKLWVTLFGRTDYELVSPLIDSLTCDLPSPNIPEEIDSLIKFRTFKEMLLEIPLERERKKKSSKKFESNTVRSIQRLPNPKGLDVHEVSEAYSFWLPRHMKNLIQVKGKGDFLYFKLLFLPWPLLTLHRQEDSEDLDRVKFHVVGGVLTKTKDTGWLEFRKVCGDKFTLASINNFVPSLPWYIYKYTQAFVHLRVMHAFGRYLNRLK